jgi:hypothetical protein
MVYGIGVEIDARSPGIAGLEGEALVGAARRQFGIGLRLRSNDRGGKKKA